MSRPSSAGHAALLLLCVALLAVRVPVAMMPAMWIDEAFSLHHAQGSIAHLWTEGWRLETSPPLYYSLLWAWVRVFGDGEFGARLLSLSLTVGTAACVYGAARTLGGRTAGAVAALVSLLPALSLEYSIEIRPYALQHLCIAVALCAWARVLVEARHGGLRGPSEAAWALAPVVLAAIASFYTHTTSFAFIAGLAGSAAVYGLATRAGRSHAIAWGAACAVTAVACLPQALAALGVAQSNRAGLAWMPPTFDLVLQSRLWRSFALGHTTWSFMLSIPAALAVFGAFALAAWRMRSRPEVLAIGVGVPVLGVTLMLMAGVLQSVLLPRTVSWLWLPLAVMVGCAAASLDRRALWPRAAGFGFAVLFAATSIAYLSERESQRPWFGVLAELGDRIRAGERIAVLDPEVGCLLARYATGPLRDAPRGRLELGDAQLFRSGQRLDIGCNQLSELGPERLAAPAATWVLTGDALQRSDLDRFVARERCGVSVADTVARDGIVLATRLVPSLQAGAIGDCPTPPDTTAPNPTHAGARP